MSKSTTALIKPTPWREVIILCRKCGKKLDGGFGPTRQDSLKKVIRDALRVTGHRRDVKVLETACLGVCPKQGVTALNATVPGKVHVIPAGSDGQDAMRTLLGRHAVTDPVGIEAA